TRSPADPSIAGRAGSRILQRETAGAQVSFEPNRRVREKKQYTNDDMFHDYVFWLPLIQCDSEVRVVGSEKQCGTCIKPSAGGRTLTLQNRNTRLSLTMSARFCSRAGMLVSRCSL